jgi:hypothetical protein
MIWVLGDFFCNRAEGLGITTGSAARVQLAVKAIVQASQQGGRGVEGAAGATYLQLHYRAWHMLCIRA